MNLRNSASSLSLEKALRRVNITKGMIMRLAKFAIGAMALACVAMPIPAAAQFDAMEGAAEKRSGQGLVQACQADQGAPTSWCAAYLMGIADTLTAFGQGGHKGGLCGATYQINDLTEIFLTWIHKHPQFLEMDMLAGASLALRERWPCR